MRLCAFISQVAIHLGPAGHLVLADHLAKGLMQKKFLTLSLVDGTIHLGSHLVAEVLIILLMCSRYQLFFF